MATATPIHDTIKPPVIGAILSLTLEEAQTLRQILRSIGGDINMSRRKHANAIEQALASTGIAASNAMTTGSIYFDDRSK